MFVTTDVAVQQFLRRCRSRSLSPATIAAYKWALEEFAAAFPAWLPTEPEVIEAHLEGLERLSVRSKWNVWRALRTFYNFCERRMKVPNAAAAVEPPKLKKGAPKALSEVQVKNVLALKLSRRDKALLVLLLDTGLRRGELAGLTQDDVHEDAIAVQGKSGRRYVPLSSMARRALLGVELPWRGEHGEPLTKSGVYQAVKKALRKAGIAAGGPHLLRHTFGVHYAMAGGDLASLQTIMGHANASSTLIYLRLVTPQVRQQHAKYSLLITQQAGEEEAAPVQKGEVTGG